MSEQEEELIPLPKWLQIIDRIKTRIEGFEPKDRLEQCGAIAACIDAVGQNCRGWISWLSHPETMNEFNEVQLKMLFERLQHITTEFLNVDMEASRILVSRIELKYEVEPDKTPGVM